MTYGGVGGGAECEGGEEGEEGQEGRGVHFVLAMYEEHIERCLME